MSKVLGITSTTYHLLVFLFIKEIYFPNDEVDLIVTDKTPFMEELCQAGNFSPHFHKVFFADGRKIKNPYKAAFSTLWESFVHNKTMNEILFQPSREGTFQPATLETYDKIYFASPGMPDEIVKEIGKTAIKRNRKVTFHRFEDGFASYTKKPEHLINTPVGQKMYRLFLRYDICKMERDIFLFEPYLMEDFSLEDKMFYPIRIEKNDTTIQKVIQTAKDIFQFESQKFEEHFMLLGQGTANNSQNPSTYQKLFYEILDITGYENLILKPHPRGIYDDFKGAIKTYTDYCPFELAVANSTLEDKVLISYYSTACITGKLLFNSDCKIIFLYPMAEDAFNEQSDYPDYFRKLTELYDNIYIAYNRSELKALLDTL